MFGEAGALDLVDSGEDSVPHWSSWWAIPGLHPGCRRHIGDRFSTDFDSTLGALPASQAESCYSGRCRAEAGRKEDVIWHLPVWIQI